MGKEINKKKYKYYKCGTLRAVINILNELNVSKEDIVYIKRDETEKFYNLIIYIE